MITGLQLALTGGALAGAGVAIGLWRLIPADPDLADVLTRLSPVNPRRRPTTGAGSGAVSLEQLGRDDKLGIWALRHLPVTAWARTPTKELALLRIPVQRHYGKKMLYGLIGLAIPPLLTLLFTLLGWRLPVLIPTAGSIGLAVFLFITPDLDVRTEAKKARTEFTRALGAYIDLVALERLSGAGSRQAMESAAAVSESWVFARIGEELSRSRWSGLAPWDALHALADELGLPELDDLADIMRLSGEGAQVYRTLRARSAAMRTAMLTDELAKANATGERMSIPMSLLGVIFMAILVAPALLRVMAG